MLQSFSQPLNHVINQPIIQIKSNQPTNQSINQSINQPINQSTNQSINRSIDPLFNRCDSCDRFCWSKYPEQYVRYPLPSLDPKTLILLCVFTCEHPLLFVGPRPHCPGGRPAPLNVFGADAAGVIFIFVQATRRFRGCSVLSARSCEKRTTLDGNVF